MSGDDVPAGRASVVANRPMSSRLPAARRREQLLDVALHVFAERGFHQHVDERRRRGRRRHQAGAVPALLVEAGALPGAAELGERPADGRDPAGHGCRRPPREQVEDGLRAYFRFVADHADAYR